MAGTVVTIAALLVRDGLALLVRRPAGLADAGGLWDLPGGTLLDGEDDIDAAALRVIEQELAVRALSCEFVETKYAPLAAGEPRVDNLYLVEDWEGEPRLASGLRDDLAWFLLDDLDELDIVEPRRSLVRALLGLDEAGGDGNVVLGGL